MCSVNISDCPKTPSKVVFSVPSHTRSIFNSAYMIFFVFFLVKNHIFCFTFSRLLSLNISERFNWNRWTFISTLFRFHSVWDWIRFLAQARKAQLALQNMRSWVRSRSLNRLILRWLHQSVAEGTERPMMQPWSVRCLWIRFLPPERRFQSKHYNSKKYFVGNNFHRTKLLFAKLSRLINSNMKQPNFLRLEGCSSANRCLAPLMRFLNNL